MKLFFCLLLLSAFIQQLPAQPQKQFTFTHYTTATGLQSNQVNTALQDDEGYIWMGTTEGLVRFDGIRYKTFQHKNTDGHSLPSNVIEQLLFDKNKNLWVVTKSGKAGIFNTKTFTFQPVAVEPVLTGSLKAVSKSLWTADDGNVFLLLGGQEILIWSIKENSFRPLSYVFPVHNDWKLTGIAKQPGTEKYFIGLQQGGVAVFNKATGNLSYAGNNIENEPIIERLQNYLSPQHLLFDRKGRLWFVIASANYPILYRYDLNSAPITSSSYEFFSALKTYNEINQVFEQDDGTIWIRGLAVFGYYIENEKRFELIPAGYENEKGIDYRTITCLFEDREMNLWVGTAINGIFRFNPSQEFFSNIKYVNRVTNDFGDNGISALSPDTDGSLLVGVLHDGLFRFDQHFNRVPLDIRGIPENNFLTIRNIYRDADSISSWFASQPGFYKYDGRRHAAIYYDPALMQDRSVRRITGDQAGNIWFGMETKGVFKWNAKKGSTRFEDGLQKLTVIPDVKINAFSFDNNNQLWIATALDGLFVVDPASDSVIHNFTGNLPEEKYMKEEGINCLLQYSDSLMLIATTARLLIYNTMQQKLRVFASPDILTGDIASLQKDSKGYLWISTTTALYRVNLQSRVFIRFNRDDGIMNDYFILAASCKWPDGRLLFGAVGEFIAFNPEEILWTAPQPHLTITDFRVMNRSLRVDSLASLPQVDLGYENNSLIIEFSTLNYITAYVIQYKLENIDKEWITADKNNQAVYSYLPPGNYLLQFNSIDSEGKRVISNTKLRIRVNPPFWKTWWFYSILLLGTGGLIFWLDRTRTKRKETLQKMRSNIAGNLHGEVNTALNNINILSEMARLKADKEPEKSKEFIEQIHTRSHKMIIAMDDMLWSISPDNDSMEKIVARMKEYIDAINNRRGMSIGMRTDNKVKVLDADMQFRHEAFLLFKDSIMAVLDAGIGLLMIDLLVEKEGLVYQLAVSNLDGGKIAAATIEENKHAHAINAIVGMRPQKDLQLLEIKIPLK